MAWTYSAWNQEATDTAKLSMLRQHIQEVSDKIGPDISNEGASRSSGSLNAYLARLEEQEERLARRTERRGRGYLGNLSGRR